MYRIECDNLALFYNNEFHVFFEDIEYVLRHWNLGKTFNGKEVKIQFFRLWYFSLQLGVRKVEVESLKINCEIK